MAESNHSLEQILQFCAGAAPKPWYPSAYAKESGTPRDSLDPLLEQLRLGGLIRLTDWEKGLGQGYALTPEGSQVLQNPRQLAQLRDGQVPRVKEAEKPAAPPFKGTTAWDRGEEVREALLSRRAPVVTYPLIYANMLVFLVGLILAYKQGIPYGEYLSGSADRIIDQTGAVSYYHIVVGQWWRLITACFVHVGLLHLIVNMFALYQLGPISERFWGPWRFLAIYLIAGWGGNCAAMLAGSEVAGASGALCGILASQVVWIYLNRAFLPPPLHAAWLRNLAMNFVLIAFISFLPRVSMSGHLGGTIAGFAAATLMYYFRFGRPVPRILCLAGLIALPLAGYGIVEWHLARYKQPSNRDAMQFGRVRREVGELEKQAMNIYKRHLEAVVIVAPAKRDPSKLQRALGEVELAKAKLAEAVSVVETAGPFAEQDLEESRLTLLNYCQTQLAIFELFEQKLREGENWRREKELQKLYKKMEQLSKAWKERPR